MTDSYLRDLAQRIVSRWPSRVRVTEHANVHHAADGVVFVEAVIEVYPGDEIEEEAERG